MWPLAIVEVHPVVDDALGSEAVGNVLKVDRFIFERPSETFDEDTSPITFQKIKNIFDKNGYIKLRY